ncbi:hypothetical protein TNCV_1570391 [Trichonephila clavipes]|uniref:Uncharacterized protein n=1 Tax=Trichonephila clavipes TaxID=2585209 RepID=A0A8X6SYN4_TRICX|nr:hypothetical protein TNCV_1570391 [Trichonephila clavipes]
MALKSRHGEGLTYFKPAEAQIPSKEWCGNWERRVTTQVSSSLLDRELKSMRSVANSPCLVSEYNVERDLTITSAREVLQARRQAVETCAAKLYPA